MLLFLNSVDIEDLYFNINNENEDLKYLNTDWINNSTNQQRQQVIVDANSLKNKEEKNLTSTSSSFGENNNLSYPQQVIVFNDAAKNKNENENHNIQNENEMLQDNIELDFVIESTINANENNDESQNNDNFNPLSFLNSIHSLKKSGHAQTTVIKNISDGEITEFSNF